MLSVLIIDDEEEVLGVTKLFLERFGEMNVTTSHSAKESLVLLNQQVFDAIIVDYDMPEINGIEFLKILRAKGDTTPVIIFTGVGREYAAIEALNNGANFFLKKGEDIQPQLREMVHMIRRAIEGKIVGKGLGTTQKILSDTVGFFREPAFAVDRDGKVIAWNGGMAGLSGVPAADMIGKKDKEYAVPFFKNRVPVLVDMIFEEIPVIQKNNFFVIAKEDQTVTAWTKAPKEDGGERILWMKATPLYDGRGIFVGVLGGVKDITHTLGPELLSKQAAETAGETGTEKAESPGGQGNMFGRLLAARRPFTRRGSGSITVRAGTRMRSPRLTRPLRSNRPMLLPWHDRGICLRALERNEEALASLTKALELSPDDEEILFSCADTLKKIGILRDDEKILTAAMEAYNRLLEKNPSNADAWNNMGICAQEVGREDLSRQYFERARDLKRYNKDKFRRRNIESLI